MLSFVDWTSVILVGALLALVVVLVAYQTLFRSASMPEQHFLEQLLVNSAAQPCGPASGSGRTPRSVNYHFTRQCNYQCGFCFHTAKTSYKLPIERALEGIRLLREKGMEKINFAGGEPFLEPKMLAAMVMYSHSLGLAVSIVSNGSKITREWLEQYGQYVDILAVSCDSFDEVVNREIGRGSGKHRLNVFRIADWCRDLDIRFKINTVVNALNWEEDMNLQIAQLEPSRWKVFQVLTIDGENDGNKNNAAKRDASKFAISNEQFRKFLERHSEQRCLVPENNDDMRTSYLILDEYMRFLDCSGDQGKAPSGSILDIGVDAALAASGFDEALFEKRGGVYDWKRVQSPMCGELPKELQW